LDLFGSDVRSRFKAGRRLCNLILWLSRCLLSHVISPTRWRHLNVLLVFHHLIYYYLFIYREWNKCAKFLLCFMFSKTIFIYSATHIRTKPSSIDLFFNPWSIRTKSDRGLFRTIWKVSRSESRVRRYYVERVERRILGRDKPVSSHPFRTSRCLTAQDNRPFLDTEKHGKSHVSLRVAHEGFRFVEIPIPTKYPVVLPGISRIRATSLPFELKDTPAHHADLDAMDERKKKKRTKRRERETFSRFGERERERIGHVPWPRRFASRLLGILCFRGRKVSEVRPRSRSTRQINRARTVSDGIGDKWTFLVSNVSRSLKRIATLLRRNVIVTNVTNVCANGKFLIRNW